MWEMRLRSRVKGGITRVNIYKIRVELKLEFFSWKFAYQKLSASEG